MITLKEFNKKKIMIIISVKNLNDGSIDLLNKKKVIIELRDDLIDSKQIQQYSLKIKIPILLTHKNGNKEQFKELLTTLLTQGVCVTFVDLDYKEDISLVSYIREKFPKIKIISSFHDFEKTPPLEEVINSMKRFKADLYKIVCMANSSLDAFRLINFIKNRKEIIGHSMGEEYAFSRILSYIINKAIYCSLDDSIAPGQIGLDILEKRYRIFQINEKTKLLALIGQVDRSYSHITHNKILSIANLNVLYLKIPIMKELLNSFFQEIQDLPFLGFSVTTPLKEEVIKYLKQVDLEVPKFNSVNTLVNTKVSTGVNIRMNTKMNTEVNRMLKDGWVGYNTDGIGALRALKKRVNLKDKKIIILGIGPTARSIGYLLSKESVSLTILNRSQREKDFCKKIKAKFGNIYDRSLYKYDVLINCTSSLDPISEEYLLANTIVMDLNANPPITPFLQKAKSKNCQIIYGFEIFINQAKEQFSLFFKK